MKKAISLICALALALSVCVFPVGAVSIRVESEDPVNTLDENGILNSAPIQILQRDHGIYEISLSQVKALSNSDVITRTMSSSEEENFVVSEVKFIAFSEEEAEAIIEELNNLRAAGGTIDDDRGLLGNSCHIYISLSYSTSYGSAGKLYRVNKVTASYKTNSGTTVPWKSLNLSCISVQENGKAVTYVKNYESIPNPCTKTEMSSLPYVYNAGPSLGATFEVTAKRPSGESVTSYVSAMVFQN